MICTKVAIAGVSSEVGKTTLLCELLRELPGWEAIKMTRGHYRSWRVICRNCGEEVNDGREFNLKDGSALCQPCAFVAGHQKFLSNSERQSQVTVSCA